MALIRWLLKRCGLRSAACLWIPWLSMAFWKHIWFMFNLIEYYWYFILQILPFACCSFWIPVRLNVCSHFEHFQSVLTINSAISSDQSVSRTLWIIQLRIFAIRIHHEGKDECCAQYTPSIQNIFSDKNAAFHIILHTFKVTAKWIRFKLCRQFFIIAYGADVKCLIKNEYRKLILIRPNVSSLRIANL